MITISGRRALAFLLAAVAVVALAAVVWPLVQARARAEMSDEAAGRVALAAGRAYFTVEPGHMASWLDGFAEFSDQATRDFLQMFVWPLLEERGVASRATALAADRVYAGTDPLTGRRWQVWRVSLAVEEPWPGEPPPALGPFAIPWATQAQVEVYVSLLEEGGRWRFSLFPAQKVLATLASHDDPLWQGQEVEP
jgi:hypothetical protein